MKDVLFRKNHKIDVKSTTMPLAEEKNNDRLVPYRANTLQCCVKVMERNQKWIPFKVIKRIFRWKLPFVEMRQYKLKCKIGPSYFAL